MPQICGMPLALRLSEGLGALGPLDERLFKWSDDGLSPDEVLPFISSKTCDGKQHCSLLPWIH